MLITEEYRRLNVQLHDGTDYGTSGHRWASTISDLSARLGTRDILDYGCGKRTLRAALGYDIKEYDPCVPGLDNAPEPADIVVCGDVLEHIEPECVDAVLDDLQRVTKKACMLVVSTRPARRTLADGRNAHLIQEPFSWWSEKLRRRFKIFAAKENKYGFLAFVGPKDKKRVVNGFVWPEKDISCAPAAFKQLEDLQQYYGYCKAFDVAVQAGGNCGVWPKNMAAKFGLVYTFEPDPENFNCLSVNVTEHNVIKMQAALGDRYGLIDVVTPDETNCGSKYVQPGGVVPTIRIDDLCLPKLDFLMLDIEGAEVNALLGGMETIKRCRPVVVVENKPHTQRFGYENGESIKVLESIGYKVAFRRHADVLLCA